MHVALGIAMLATILLILVLATLLSLQLSGTRRECRTKLKQASQDLREASEIARKWADRTDEPEADDD